MRASPAKGWLTDSGCGRGGDNDGQTVVRCGREPDRETRRFASCIRSGRRSPPGSPRLAEVYRRVATRTQTEPDGPITPRPSTPGSPSLRYLRPHRRTVDLTPDRRCLQRRTPQPTRPWPGRYLRLRRHDYRNERRRLLRLSPVRPPPCKKLRRRQPMPSRNCAHRRAGAPRFRRRSPPSPRPTRPAAARADEHLKPPGRLRHRLKL